MICVERESARAGRSAEAQQPQRHSITACPPLNTALATSVLLSPHRSAAPHPLFSERTEPRGRGLPPGSVSRAPRQLVGGECATCVRHGRGGGGLGALEGPCWAWACGRRAWGGGPSWRRLYLEVGFHGWGESGWWLGKGAAWWAVGGGGGRNAGGWALATAGGGVRGVPLLMWCADLEDISPRLVKDDPKELGRSSERPT